MPKVSVIVATYNHENYIAQTLESIVKQKCDFTFEAIVGDDASKDKTAKVVSEYAEKYPDIIKPVLRKKNLGSFRNILDLYKRAKGDYVAMLEGDDYWIAEDKLQMQVDFLEEHPDHIAHFGRCIVIDRAGNRNAAVEEYMYAFPGGEYTVSDFNDYYLPGQTATAMYRHSTLESLMDLLKTDKKVRPRVPIIDRFLVLGALHFGKIHTDSSSLAAYRFVLDSDSGSWSSKNNAYSFRNLFLFLMGLREFERIGRHLDLAVDFDERRRFEYRKISSSKEQFPGIVRLFVKFLIILSYRNKRSLGPVLIKKIKKRIRRLTKH
ncbi:MAG: glycosyltransferase [Lachnospiraceae bacterium]|nr:glycosyltransferase [Lachnospiraceae bacterium]